MQIPLKHSITVTVKQVDFMIYHSYEGPADDYLDLNSEAQAMPISGGAQSTQG